MRNACHIRISVDTSIQKLQFTQRNDTQTHAISNQIEIVFRIQEFR